LLAHVKNRFDPTQSPEMKQLAGLTVQSGLKAGASSIPANDDTNKPYVNGSAMLSPFNDLMDDS
jgi:hypothetical protein